MLGDNADRSECSPHRERTCIAHEHHRGRCVVPEKSETGADQSTTENRQLANANNVVELQVSGINTVSDEIRDETETCGGDHDRHNRQAVESVRQVDGIRRADRDEDREGDEEPAEIDQNILEKGMTKPSARGAGVIIITQ